jgi:hypothetical protein
VVHATVLNLGDQQEWIELSLEAELADVDGLSIFDGRNVADQPQEQFGEDEFIGRLHVCSAWNSDASLGLALAPSELRSWFHHSYLPDGANGSATLSTMTRVVLDPDQDDSVSFWAASRPGEWGFYESLDAYYETYPAFFDRDPEVDPRVDLGSAEYRAWRPGNWAPEICRRLYAGWDWCYAPFKRTGDIVGRERFWEYDPAREPQGERAWERERFLQWRREKFEEGRRTNCVMGFYVPAQVWCEEQLAQEHYPDALIEDPDTRTLFTTPWVTGHDNERLVFPYETSFGEQSRKDMRAVAEELDLRAFAFDTAGGRGKYRGPALPELEGRSWDEDGVYCRNNIAVANVMQFVHTLRADDGTNLAVISNPNPRCAYSSVIWSDSMMLEGEPWKVDRTYGDSLRWMAGQKTLVWWEGYNPQTFIDLEQASDEQVAMLLRGLADFTLLQSLRIGFIPPPYYTQGFERLVQWLPALVECVQTGWQPVPAARVPEPLWSTRYGNGLDTLIAIAHEEKGAHEIEVAIENERFAEGAVLFTDYDGSQRTNTIVDGESRITLVVPTRTPRLLRAQAEVLPADAITEAVARADFGLTGGHVTLELAGQGEVIVRVRVPDDMQIAVARFDGETVPVEDATVTVDLDGAGELRVQMRSPIFRGSETALLGFPFATEAGPTSTIYLREDAGEAEEYLAERLQLYFDYWFERIKGREAPAIPITRGEPSGTAAVIRSGADEARVEIVEDVLYIEAPSEAELEDVFFGYLRGIDTEYWTPDTGYGGWFPRAKGDDPWLTWPEKR